MPPSSSSHKYYRFFRPDGQFDLRVLKGHCRFGTGISVLPGFAIVKNPNVIDTSFHTDLAETGINSYCSIFVRALATEMCEPWHGELTGTGWQKQRAPLHALKDGLGGPGL
jgi:hypothetical protein